MRGGAHLLVLDGGQGGESCHSIASWGHCDAVGSHAIRCPGESLHPAEALSLAERGCAKEAVQLDLVDLPLGGRRCVRREFCLVF